MSSLAPYLLVGWAVLAVALLVFVVSWALVLEVVDLRRERRRMRAIALSDSATAS